MEPLPFQPKSNLQICGISGHSVTFFLFKNYFCFKEIIIVVGRRSIVDKAYAYGALVPMFKTKWRQLFINL